MRGRAYFRTVAGKGVARIRKSWLSKKSPPDFLPGLHFRDMPLSSLSYFRILASGPGVRANKLLFSSAILMVSACGSSSEPDPNACQGSGCGAGAGAQVGSGSSTASGGATVDGSGGAGTGATGSITTGGTPGTGGAVEGGIFATEVTIEEGEAGQCEADGAVESDHVGFTGTGYLNSDNAPGASIEWAVDVGEAGAYTLEFSYASEPAGDRPGDVLVSGVVVAPALSFPSTAAWTTYSTSSVEVTLTAGENRIILSATGATGLGNIDSLKVTGAAVGAFDCTGAVGTGGAGTGGAGTGGAGTGGAGTGGQSGDPTCDAGVWDGNTPQVLNLSGNTFAHDPTMIKANGTYYRFWTGGNVPQSRSTNLTNWSNAPSVINGTPSWVNTWLNGISGSTYNFPWAPDVSYFGGRYHIYSSFSARFGQNISCIGHFSTSDIASNNWTDHGAIICTDGSQNYNAIDADVGVTPDGTPWFSFGSFWGGIYSFELNQDGSRKDNNITHLARASQIEAPVLFYRCGYYYLLVTWGICCPGEGRSVNDLTYRVAVGRSTSITGPFVDKSGKALTDGGGTLIVQGDKVNWAAAGHSDVLFDDDKIYHLYHGYRQSNGAAELRIAEMPFDEQGWPVPAATP